MADWDERYRHGEGANADPDPVVVKFAVQLSPGRALDIACGTGRHSIWLAERGWHVVAVDGSHVAIDLLKNRSTQSELNIDCIVADLEKSQFVIPPQSYDLIVVCNYLQRDLFPSIKNGTRLGGVVIALISMIDDDPNVKAMNPAFLLNAGELRSEFRGWKIIWDREGQPQDGRRARAEIVARRLV